MRVVHMSDLHLGKRSGRKLTNGGGDVRERDIARAFSACIDRTIALAPDLVVCAGDVFDAPHPSNAAIVHAFGEFSRLTKALPGVPVVIACGNHDTSRTADGGTIFPLFRTIGVHVAIRRAEWFEFPDRDLAVLAVPDVLGAERPALIPSDARYNVLCLHGEVDGVTQGGADRRACEGRITRDTLIPERWSYVALGHYHQYEQLAPNMAYSGAPEYTSSNVWAEIGTPKGLVEHDCHTCTQTLHAIQPRPHFDLSVDGAGLDPSAVDAALAERLASIAIDGAVVRVKLLEVERRTARDLDQAALRAFRARALSLFLDVRPPAVTVAGSDRAVRKEKLVSLREMLRGKLAHDPELEALGLSYFDRAEELTRPRAVEEQAGTAQEGVAA